MAYIDSNFDKKTEDIINSYEPLADWFNRNDECISYCEICLDSSLDAYKYRILKDRKGYKFASNYLLFVKDMTDACILWFNTKYNYSDQEKALKAACAIKQIYESEKNNYNDKEKYALDIKVDGITEEFAADALTPPDLYDLKVQYVNTIKEEKFKRIAELDQEKQAILDEIKELDNSINQDINNKTF